MSSSLQAQSACKKGASVLLHLATFLVVAFILYVWCIVSCLGLIRRDTIEPAVSMGGPVNHVVTLFCCLGPLGWFLALGVFCLAWMMSLIIHPWPWPLRVTAVAAIPVWMVYQTVDADMDVWVWKVLMVITSLQVLLAVSAALFCRSLAKWILRRSPEASKLPFFSSL